MYIQPFFIDNSPYFIYKERKFPPLLDLMRLRSNTVRSILLKKKEKKGY